MCTWKNPNQAAIAAIQCITGGKNSHIFYSQKTRRQIFSNGMATTKTTHADCVSFVEQASRVATGKKNLKYPGAWSASLNAGKSKTLKNTGLFQDFRIYKKGMTLYTGDLMWRAGKGFHGHIIMVVAGKTRTTTVDISEIQKLALQGGGDDSLESSSFDQVYDMAAGVETMISSDNYKWLDEFEKKMKTNQ